jgi:hypothetical protein
MPAALICQGQQGVAYATTCSGAAVLKIILVQLMLTLIGTA